MTEKCKKGLFLPDWVVALLDAGNGVLYNGQGWQDIRPEAV